MKKKILIMGVALIICLGIFTACIDNKPTEQAQSGAYFATGNGGEYAVILDDKISLYWDAKNNRFDVFQFSPGGNSYVGKSVRSDISFKVFGDNLTITLKSPNIGFNGSKKIKLKRNNSIEVSDKEPIQLAVPNIDKSAYNERDGEHNGISWDFEAGHQSSLFLHQNGILGASVELKRPNLEDFIAEKIRDYIPEPACFFDIGFHDLKLTQGFNVLRIKHLGGPFVDADNNIRLSLNSESVYVNITVNSEGNVTALEIQ